MNKCKLGALILLLVIASAASTEKCQVDSDCSEAPFYVCGSEKVCEHKKPFPSLGLEWGGYLTITVIMTMCNVAGIGGGAID